MKKCDVVNAMLLDRMACGMLQLKLRVAIFWHCAACVGM